MGFRLRREPLDGNVEVLLSKRSRDRIYEKILQLTPRTWGQKLSRCIRGLNAYLTGWVGFFGICTASEMRTLQAVDAHIRRRLRALLLRQWKRRRTIVKRLIRLGVRAKTAWTNVYRGYNSRWALSHNPVVDRGLRNAYFAERGLISVWETWSARHQSLAIAPLQLTLQWDNCGRP